MDNIAVRIAHRLYPDDASKRDAAEAIVRNEIATSLVALHRARTHLNTPLFSVATPDERQRYIDIARECCDKAESWLVGSQT